MDDFDFDPFGGNEEDYGAPMDDFNDTDGLTQLMGQSTGECQTLTPLNPDQSSALCKNATASALEVADYELPPVSVKNLIAGFNTGCDLDLRLITVAARNVEYNPKKQNAAIVRLQAPYRATCMIFPSGRVSVTGIKVPEDAKKVAKIVCRLIQRAGHPDATFRRFKIESLVCSAACGFPVRLENLAQDHGRFATYEPEIFCGLVYRYQISQSVKASILVFVSGKIIITGCKKPSEADDVFKNLYAVLYQYRA